MKTFHSLLNSEKGLGLIEILASLVIITIAVVGLYIGILYGNMQLTLNYRERVATLIASGEVDYQYWHYYAHNYTFDSNRYNSMEVVLEDYEDPRLDDLVATVRMEASIKTDKLNKELRYARIKIIVTWEEKVSNSEEKEYSVCVVEDFY